MNKQTKGAIAAGAAALLLAGGAGSFALWSDTETLNGGTISSGKLSLETVGTPGWTKGGSPVTISSYKAVPGDVLVYNAKAKIGAVGDNLHATLKADASSITGDPELLAALAPQTTATLNGDALATGATGVAINQDNDGQTVDVQVTFTFNATGTTAQTQSVNLANFNLTLTQDS
ncbi:alternate-type signal peptide domain-containing protein [Rhodococcus sp. AG1013]|uniref:alternate-type signal peptide domain-containing protein n=1 Tax=unclassified Rhodococcus (in: high G+C Gram-positive bacteria) TaxID=192944 RepID=UPI000E0B6A2E|nr:alternate-type signal peptide domain-containing protein [Rhodococcus sp. AG1013]RDI20487.1 alternate signal-mediated exported protein [Rhodococcus sp. AG1013]